MFYSGLLRKIKKAFAGDNDVRWATKQELERQRKPAPDLITIKKLDNRKIDAANKRKAHNRRREEIASQSRREHREHL